MPLLGLEHSHDYLDRYSAKGQMRRGLPDLSRETICLDDDFTAEELRMIDTTGGAGLSDKEMEEAWNNGERKSVITQVLKPR